MEIKLLQLCNVLSIFSDDIASQLCKHLQRTLCTDLTNNIVSYLAQEHGLTAVADLDTVLSLEVYIFFLAVANIDFFVLQHF